MKLSKRLQSIANFVPLNSIIADVGTDHGYVAKYLIEEEISKLVIATDISQGSLDKTIELIHEGKYYEKIKARLGDGLDPIKPFEVDTLIIAGMGGLLIRDILEAKKDVACSIVHFIFQPMVASKELREYLINNNFKIIDEDLVFEDNKYYEIIYAKRGLQQVENDIHFEIGYKLIEKRHPLLKKFIEFKIKKNMNLLDSLKDKDSEKSLDRVMEIKDLLVQYKGVYNTVEGK